MNNFSLNKYHTYIFFGLSVIFAFINFTLDLEYISIICFFLISTIGVSHGALDHEKGKKIIKLFKSKKIELFYLAYVSLSLIIILLWSIAPIITLIIYIHIYNIISMLFSLGNYVVTTCNFMSKNLMPQTSFF